MKIIENEKIEKMDQLIIAQYEQCEFFNCQFAETDFRDFKFIECTFIQCDLSNTNIINCAFMDCIFKDCKLIGLSWGDCQEFLFQVKFDNCILNYASFYKVNLKNTLFNTCQLIEVDFTEANLMNSNFKGSDLLGAIFEQTNLIGSDLSDAMNFLIDPERNKIKSATFSRNDLEKLLNAYQIKII